MARWFLLILCGASLIASAQIFESNKRKKFEANAQSIAMLRTRLDSVRALYATAATAVDSARLKQQIDERIYGIGRWEYHVPIDQKTLDAWWTPSGTGSLLSVGGILLMLVGIFFVRRTARTQRRD